MRQERIGSCVNACFTMKACTMNLGESQYGKSKHGEADMVKQARDMELTRHKPLQ